MILANHYRNVKKVVQTGTDNPLVVEVIKTRFVAEAVKCCGHMLKEAPTDRCQASSSLSRPWPSRRS